MERFTGTIAQIMLVEVGPLIRWVREIPFDAWPQQHKEADGSLRPAMVNDPLWHDFHHMSNVAVAQVCQHLEVAPGRDTNRMLSVVMPGRGIDWHRDLMVPTWLGRIHIPLVSNPKAYTCVVAPKGREIHKMRVGQAYWYNTERYHSTWNGGDTPRIHFLFDLCV